MRNKPLKGGLHLIGADMTQRETENTKTGAIFVGFFFWFVFVFSYSATGLMPGTSLELDKYFLNE